MCLLKSSYTVFGTFSNSLDQKVWLRKLEWICCNWITIRSHLNIISRIFLTLKQYIPIFTFSFGISNWEQFNVLNNPFFLSEFPDRSFLIQVILQRIFILFLACLLHWIFLKLCLKTNKKKKLKDKVKEKRKHIKYCD